MLLPRPTIKNILSGTTVKHGSKVHILGRTKFQDIICHEVSCNDAGANYVGKEN